jgi:signal transduction histidine kinase
MADKEQERHPILNLLNRFRYLGVAVALLGGAGLTLVVLKDVIFRGGAETTLGVNSFIAILAVGATIIFAIVADARAKNRALSERADKLGEMAKRMHITVEELNDANQELARARLQSDFANQAKSEFLSKLSKEIHGPINAILADVLKLRGAQELGPGERRLIDDLARNGVGLSAIIADVVEISRMEAEGSSSNPADFDLGELVSGVQREMTGKAVGRGIDLEFATDPHSYHKVNGDKVLLRDVLEFLLTNAMDNNRQGAVRFAITRGDDGGYSFEVRDRGEVYSPEALAGIAQPFHRDRGERIKGVTGLGLAIADRRISDMGGELKIRSEEGEGCIFEFQIQLPAPGADAAATADNITEIMVAADD